MKKLILSVALCLALTLAACGAPAPSSATQPASAGTSADSAAATELKKTFGTFTLPQGWLESHELSKENFYFYLKDGTDLQKPTSNISVSYGTNKYGKGEEMDFARAIDQQLKSQVDLETVSYSGVGSSTKQDIPLITMTVEDKEALTVQYYIVGEYRYVMVQMTDFYDEQVPDVQQVALNIVDSFVWADKAE